MKFLCYVLCVLVLLCTSVITHAAPFDSGMRHWSQPTGVTFTARLWGDEFQWWMETSSGYRIVEGAGGWFFYAALDGSGEFSPTSLRVGIDSSPAGSYKLERSAARIAIINQQIAQAKAWTQQARQWYADKQAATTPGSPVVVRIGVIFVEFQDVRHYVDTRPQPTRPFGYYKTDFDSMLFSTNWYNIPQRHPEGDSLFGSFRDYWHHISRGQLIVTGTFINPVEPNGVPRWLRLDSVRTWYHYVPDAFRLKREAFQKAIDSSVINPSLWSDPRGYDRYIYIFAQNNPYLSGLTHAGDRTYIQCPERWGFQLETDLNIAFGHIGVSEPVNRNETNIFMS